MRSLLFRPQAWFAVLWIALSLGAVPVSRTYRAAEPEEPAALRREARAIIQWEKTDRLPLNARVRSQEEKEGLVWEQLTYVGGPGQVVPALVARPAGAAGRLPAVIALHGLGGSKESMRSVLIPAAPKAFETNSTAWSTGLFPSNRPARMWIEPPPIGRPVSAWKARPIPFKNGALWKYANEVGPARTGAVTHPAGGVDVECYADV